MLLAVERGGWAAELLLARSRGLESHNAGLASEIVFGTLRYQAQLDFLIHHFSGRPADRMDPEVRVALRIAIYQLRYLDRIPGHAAVNESVELVRKARKRSACGFVNAVLRKAGRQPVEWPSEATALSHPAWLLERWQSRYGAAVARAIAEANLRPPQAYLRASSALPPELDVEATEMPGCFRLRKAEGGFVFPSSIRRQDIGSQWVVPFLDLQPGVRFLDLCAAPGNKTAQALESEIRALACDLHVSRLVALKRLRIPLVVLDGARPLPFRSLFDRILVDAPCSGTGTLARNPEIKWRLQASDLADLQRRQVLLLRSAIKYLAPRGRLVYSTCSLEREENEDVVEMAIPGRPADFHQRIPGRDAGDGFFVAVIPSG